VEIEGETEALSSLPFMVELPGFLALYPSPISESALTATATDTARPRIAFTLAEAKNVELLIIDPKDLKILFRRKVSATEGYNEILWNGMTDFGNIIPPGSYILQLVENGKVTNTYPFVVIGTRR
jgi:hypothetical protein